jgi:hypothetical protein
LPQTVDLYIYIYIFSSQPNWSIKSLRYSSTLWCISWSQCGCDWVILGVTNILYSHIEKNVILLRQNIRNVETLEHEPD